MTFTLKIPRWDLTQSLNPSAHQPPVVVTGLFRWPSKTTCHLSNSRWRNPDHVHPFSPTIPFLVRPPLCSDSPPLCSDEHFLIGYDTSVPSSFISVRVEFFGPLSDQFLHSTNVPVSPMDGSRICSEQSSVPDQYRKEGSYRSSRCPRGRPRE